MSHLPFTPEYMQEGEMSSNEVNEEIETSNGNQKLPLAYNRQTQSRQSTNIQKSESVTEGCQNDQVGENPDDDIDVIREEMNITIKDNDRWSFLKILRMAIRRRMEVFAEEVSMLGPSHLVKPSTHKIGSIIRKIIWTMLLLFC